MHRFCVFFYDSVSFCRLLFWKPAAQAVVRAKDAFHSVAQTLLLMVGEASLKSNSVDLLLKEKFSHLQFKEDLQIVPLIPFFKCQWGKNKHLNPEWPVSAPGTPVAPFCSPIHLLHIHLESKRRKSWLSPAGTKAPAEQAATWSPPSDPSPLILMLSASSGVKYSACCSFCTCRYQLAMCLLESLLLVSCFIIKLSAP